MNIQSANANPVMAQMMQSLMGGAMGIASGNPLKAMQAIGQMVNAFQSLAGAGAQRGIQPNFRAPSHRFPQMPMAQSPASFGAGNLFGTQGSNMSQAAMLAPMGASGSMARGMGSLFNGMEGVQNQMNAVMANPNMSEMQKQSAMTQLNQKMSSMQNMLQMFQQMMSRMQKTMSEIIQAGSNVQNSMVSKISR